MLQPMQGFLVVFLGGGLGAALRHGVNRFALTHSPDYPWGTLCINVLGCLLMGLAAGWFTFRGEQGGQMLRLFLTTGILGGFTTFSAFSLDAALLWQRGNLSGMAIYIVGSVVLSLIAVVAGLALSRSLFA